MSSRAFSRAKAREEDRKKRLKVNAGGATQEGVFGTGVKVKWLYPTVTHSEQRNQRRVSHA